MTYKGQNCHFKIIEYRAPQNDCNIYVCKQRYDI